MSLLTQRPTVRAASAATWRRTIALAASLLTLSTTAHAADWLVCDYDVRSLKIDRAAHRLTVQLVRGGAKNPPTCPAADGEMTFTPETPDYQSTLPRKQWPAPGRSARLRYRHLDGMCKNTGPCRIQHHSLMPGPVAMDRP